MGQSESEEVSTKLQHERPPLPSTSCHPCLTPPLPAQVQWWCLILFQQQLSQQEHEQQADRCGREVLLRRRHPLPDRQPGVGWGHRWAGSWCPGSCSSWTNHTRSPQRWPAEPGLLLWKEKEASQLWRTDIRRRQAPGENEPGTRFFGGLFGGQQPHCGSCCYNTQPFNNNNNGFNSNFQNQGFNNQNQAFNNQNTGRCQCDYSLTFRDQNGNTHGACQRRDNTGRTWCYTTGWDNNCGDLQRSKRHPNNPWSYAACNNQGR